MAYLDNPAGRLSAVLERAKTVKQDQSALAAWCEVFGFDTTAVGRNQVLRRAAELIEMAQETRRLVESLEDDDPTVVLKHFKEVEATLNNFTAVANINMEQFMSSYKETAIYCLESCSSLLHRRVPEPFIGDETRNDLLNQLHGLIEQVREATDLSEPLKRFILDKLEAIFEAVYHVRTTGFGPIEKATSDLIGSVVVRRDVWSIVPATWARAVLGVAAFITFTVGNLADFKELTSDNDPQPIIVNVYEQSTGLALPPGPDRDDDGEIHEAEIVEEGEGPGAPT